MKIKFNTIKDIYDFVELTGKDSGAATLSQDRYIVSARSLLGIFSLNLLAPIELELESGNYEPFERFVSGN